MHKTLALILFCQINTADNLPNTRLRPPQLAELQLVDGVDPPHLIGNDANKNQGWQLDEDGKFIEIKGGDITGKSKITRHASNDEYYLQEGTLRGIVTRVDKRNQRYSFPYVDVTLSRDGIIKYHTKTQMDGSFFFEKVEPEDYTIVAQFSGGDEPDRAWREEAAGNVNWPTFPGSVAIQRIILRNQENNDVIPILHLSPAPWICATELAAVKRNAGGGGAVVPPAAAGSGGSGAAGGFIPPPFIPISPPNKNPSSPF